MATRTIEWYVKATRNQTSVWLAAPEGQVEAQASPSQRPLRDRDTPALGRWPERCPGEGQHAS